MAAIPQTIFSNQYFQIKFLQCKFYFDSNTKFVAKGSIDNKSIWNIFCFKGNAFEDVVCKMFAIFARPQYDNK